MIGDDIKITILGRKGDEVRIGIQAPRNIKIIRAELEPLVEPLEILHKSNKLEHEKQ